MRVVLLSFLLTTSAFAECPEISAQLDFVQSQVLEGRLVEAETGLKSAEQGFACGERSAPELLARFWLLEGTVLELGGESEAAGDSFWAAKRVAPAFWDDELGPQIAKAYAASAAPDGEDGSIEVFPTPIRYEALLDGVSGDSPMTASPGLHLVQVGPADGAMAFARLVYVAPGQSLRLDTKLVESAPALVEILPEPAGPGKDLPSGPRKKPVTGLVLAGGAALVSGAAFAMSARQNAHYSSAPTVDELDQIKTRQIGFGVTGLGMAGVGATSLILHFAL